MKVVLLAGGFGTRLQEETELRPKPMVEIGGLPILCHIMKHFHHYGCSEFTIALGYKGDYIKRFFLDAHELGGDLTIDFGAGAVSRQELARENWTVDLVDTGLHTMTGGRLRRLKSYVGDSTFILTYGDGVCDVNISELLAFHREQGRLATVTAVRPPARFGGLVIDQSRVDRFTEKPRAGEGWINGGFLVFEPGIFDYLHGDSDSLESHALEKVAADGQLSAFQHDGFWQCMDTLRDKHQLEAMWASDEAPWKSWRNRPVADERLRIFPDHKAAA